MSTPDLAIPHILQSQAQKEVTANQAFDRLDEALNDRVTVDVSAGTGGSGSGGGLPVFKGTLVKRSANQTIIDGVQTALDWESSVYDTDGFTDLGVQSTRLSTSSASRTSSVPTAGLRPPGTT